MTDADKLNLEADLLPLTDEAVELGDHSTIDAALIESVDLQTQHLEGRKRQIEATIQIAHPVEHVWKVLTDYDALADFIPNLAESRCIEHPQGGIRLEQVGTQRLLRFNFCARVVLDMEEKFPHEIRFTMVEGDFKEFSGCWCLAPVVVDDRPGTQLAYTIIVLAKRFMPISIIERRLQRDLAINLLSIRERVDHVFNQ